MHETTRLLRDLVRLPSVNPMGLPVEGPLYLEGRLGDYLENHFRERGYQYARQSVAPGRDNLLAIAEPEKPHGTLIFEVHQDTVPVEGMTIDPFGAVIDSGRLYGRGACDVKGGMAAMLAAFGRYAQERPRGGPRLVLACTVDEEFTFLGVQRLVRERLGPDPVRAVVAEPTGLDLVQAHKGVVRWVISTTGRACHSSTPEQGINAIYRMGRLLPHLEQYAERLRQSACDPLLGPPTLSVGTIHGGASVNVVPDGCRIDIDRRLIPGEQPEDAPRQLDAYLRQHTPEVEFTTQPPYLNCPSLAPTGSDLIAEPLGQAIEAVRGKKPRVLAVPYGTDASSLALAGIPSVVFGPGDIAQAHTKDEWIELAQVEMAAEILYRFACWEAANGLVGRTRGVGN
ncbi:MAG: M20 family metallopeptidase [Gemmataceae bacterium]